jgi:broad specificity phosphatase PhoE
LEGTRLHLVRHGEVFNPEGVLYGRLPGFSLSERGAAMATLASVELLREGRPVRRLLSSPLDRAQESAKPISEALGLPIESADGFIEASSHLEGGQFAMSLSILAKPRAWRYLVNPFKPSWGEPFSHVAERMLAELMIVGAETGEVGDVVVVSHQLPIWLMHRHAQGLPLFHDPRKRRCALSSITSFEWRDGELIEVGYREPARSLVDGSLDVGAV